MDRVILVPTAETHPAGTWYLSSYEIVLLQAGYALGDRSQVTFTAAPPLGKDILIPVDLTLKQVLLRSRWARVAAMGSVSGLLGYNSGEALLGRVGAVTQLCLDDKCRSSVSTAVNLLLAGSTILFLDGVGAIFRTSDHVALLLELQSVLPLGGEAGNYNGIAGAGGVRFSGRSWGVDLALGAPLDRKTNVAIIPGIAVTYRFLP